MSNRVHDLTAQQVALVTLAVLCPLHLGDGPVEASRFRVSLRAGIGIVPRSVRNNGGVIGV
jgi:hypothetical protein